MWFRPSDHVAWRRGNITKKSAIYHRYFVTRGDFFKISPIYLPEPIYRRYFGDIYGNISPPIFLHEISCRPLPIHDISAIYCRYIPTFSSLVATNFIDFSLNKIISVFSSSILLHFSSHAATSSSIRPHFLHSSPLLLPSSSHFYFILLILFIITPHFLFFIFFSFPKTHQSSSRVSHCPLTIIYHFSFIIVWFI